MNQSNNPSKITKERVVGVVGVTMCLLATSFGAAMTNSAMGLGLLTVGLVGIGAILSTTIKSKKRAEVTA